VVRPQSTEEVSSILKYCNEKRIGVVPQAGNTGLVGGSIPIHQEVVLSVEQLNHIQELDPISGILKAEAGCILQNLQDYAADRDYLVPVDLGAKGTCQIGGNVSTNAGGSYYYRYGSLHANVMGLEVVLANGDILNLSYDPCHLKDNTGYDLKHLFVGAEGTLGVVTKVALLCPRLPQSKCASFLACQSFDQVCESLTLAKSHLGEILAAFEFMDGPVLEIVQHQSDIPLPLSEIYPYSILVETHGSNAAHDQEKMESFVEAVMDQGVAVDGVLAQSLGQVQDMWKIRESCNPAVAASGYVYKYDVSLAVPDFPHFIDEIRGGIPDSAVCTNWGHIIDGNLHCNIVVPGKYEKDEELLEKIEGLVLEEVLKRGGSISAEHGLGQYKHKYMPQIKDPATLATMKAVKKQFDPNGILNPGKYLPQ
jgi:D-2-hydroxyglutarate dehydrogenase